MNDDPASNRRLMGGLAIAGAAILAALAAAIALGTPDAEKLGLSIYMLAVPIALTVLAFALPAHDIEDGMPADEVSYHRRSGLIFGGVMFALTVLVMAVMLLIR